MLAAARRLLVEKGYDRTTARDLAAASGSHLGSIGYHFGSKDALMTEAAVLAQGEWGALIDDALRAAAAGSPAERLRICIDTLVNAIDQQREILVASAESLSKAAHDENIRSALARVHGDARVAFAALALGIDRDEVDPETARGLGSLVHSMIIGLSMQALIDRDSLPTGAQLAKSIRTLAGRD
ncbi:TetR/AcrR family transcriptional regulator [Microlunatus speluncae]|uniref:TetR/AcrR family transcriptional regulator n=1 Tax=Microlunatus speluncae TaxID=2594267 RepID=UPI001FE65A7D|nr:TetR/AcrR family transcriptional regulator [Microlunatus speluncae]